MSDGFAFAWHMDDPVPTKHENHNDTHDDLHKLLIANEHDLPKTTGETLCENLSQSSASSNGGVSRLQIATVGHKIFRPSLLEKQKKIKRAESALKTRLQSLLQASQMKQGRIGRKGQIQAHRLSRVMTGDPRLFISPVVAHGAPVHPEFYTKASGGTPMGEAIWWVLQKMVLLKEARKIALILTDGFPDCKSNVTASVKADRSLGVEFYGVGIDFNNITTLFPEHSCSVGELSELAPAMFTLMKNALVKNN